MLYQEHKIYNNPKTKHFIEKYVYLVHFYYQKVLILSLNIKKSDLLAKLSTSLLRYSDEVLLFNYDYLLYQAGYYNQQLNKLNLAFIFYNQFIDICDYIIEGHDYDYDDFVQTDIPKLAKSLIKQQKGGLSYNSIIIEDIREWILENFIGNNISQELPTRICTKCKQKTYQANLRCHHCSHIAEKCIITGYPILLSTKIQCPSCHQLANRQDWNQYIIKMKKCPWCNTIQNPVY